MTALWFPELWGPDPGETRLFCRDETGGVGQATLLSHFKEVHSQITKLWLQEPAKQHLAVLPNLRVLGCRDFDSYFNCTDGNNVSHDKIEEIEFWNAAENHTLEKISKSRFPSLKIIRLDVNETTSDSCKGPIVDLESWGVYARESGWGIHHDDEQPMALWNEALTHIERLKAEGVVFEFPRAS